MDVPYVTVKQYFLKTDLGVQNPWQGNQCAYIWKKQEAFERQSFSACN